LLVGSVGLFFVLAVVMTLTRRVNWYDPASRGAIEDPQR
jgi:inner membrane protein involved in colicin E2 resistance